MSSRDVQKPTRSAPVLRLPGGKRVVARSAATFSNARRQVDLCFVFDTTGSMSGKIDGLVKAMDQLVRDLGAMALDWRITTVPFGDLTVPGDRVVGDHPFVDDVQAASAQLGSMPRFGGGANIGESSVEAMIAACHKPFRRQAVKVLVLITDDAALNHQQGVPAVHQALDRLDAACFTIAPRLDYYQAWATRHGGEWQQIAASVSTQAIKAMFTTMLTRVVKVADSVHRLGGGSVRAYLQLERGSDT